MFQVTQFDPHAVLKETAATKRRRRNLSSSSAASSDQPNSSCRVIAPDESSNRNKQSANVKEEAFDDMDIIEDEEHTWSHAVADDTRVTDQSTGSRLSRDEIQAAMRISEMPMQKTAEAWNLAPFLIDNLIREGFETFFSIQALTIPDVIASERHPHIQARDVCITAPTGSGKTLSYVLPILNSLAHRQFRKLRALIVLPSRDLADQVYRVFDTYTQGSNIRVGLAVGQSDFKAEQIALTVDSKSTSSASLRQRLYFDPGNLELALKAYHTPSDFTAALDDVQPIASPIDILICTPGRLVDHLESTPGFTLQHLRFICIDEADRLLNQRYHNWFDRVLASAHSTQIPQRVTLKDDVGRIEFHMRPDGSGFKFTPATWRRNHGGPENQDAGSVKTSAACFRQPVQLRKFLVSATLTRDPQKLASLHLVNPRHFDLHQFSSGLDDVAHGGKKYAMPSNLVECIVECTAEQKPVVLLSLILDGMHGAKKLTAFDGSTNSKGIVVVFTSSLESTHRLTRLVQLLWIASGLGNATMIAEFSSSLNQKDRATLIRRCKDVSDNLSLVICSDGMSRGMDIFVSTVINYDVPVYAKVYVHRCGRTARAGKKGKSITLLKGGQVTQFHKMRRLIQSPESVHQVGIKKQLVCNVVPHYRKCVHALKRVLEAESDGELSYVATEALLNFLSDDKAGSLAIGTTVGSLQTTHTNVE
ncbi:hypothetical protein MPSEU_000566700 [Mayamaea pseudoterrestris]|nr:hypothetical protein MPSEU_000566700 [Mayamaea pseudoterrestris]